MEQLRSHKRVAVAACCLCFVLGILAGMRLTQQHYESAMGYVEMAPVAEGEAVEEKVNSIQI